MWGARKKSGGLSWTTSELSSSTPTSGQLQPRTRGNCAGRRNKGRDISWRNRSLQRKPGWITACGNMLGCDEKDKIEDTPRLLLNAKSDMLDPDIPKKLPQQPVASALGIEPMEEVIVRAIKAMANAKAVGPDGLPVELLNLGLQEDRTILLELHRLTTLIWREMKVPQQPWKDAVITVIHKKKGARTECGNYGGTSLVSHADKVLLKVVARRLSAYCKANRLLQEEQCGFRPERSTTDMMFVVRRLQEIGRKAGVSLFMCFIDLQKAYDTVDRTLLWQVLPRIEIPPQMIPVIQQFHERDESLCAT